MGEQERTCAECGHLRDVHGAWRGPNGGFQCNRIGGCACPGYVARVANEDSADA